MRKSMSSNQQPLPTPVYYGWVIVILAALGLFFSGPGQTYGVSIFINSYIKQFGWSRSLVSSLYSSATLVSGLSLFVMGRLVDRFGPRFMMVAVGILLAAACLWNSLVGGPIMLFVGFLSLRFFGQGSMSLIPNTLVPQWFIAKRGRALSFMAIGGFVSAAALPPLNTWLIQTWGWQGAWRFWAAALVVVFVPLALLLVRNTPEAIGLLPDGDEASPDDALEPGADEDLHPGTALTTGSAAEAESDWTLEEAMRSRTFWFILYCGAVPAMVHTGMTFHLVSIFHHANVPTTQAALVLSLMAITGFPISLLAGFILEHVPVHLVMSVTFTGELVLLFMLQHLVPGWDVLAFGLVWGIVTGAERIVFNIIWPDYFGRTNLGSIRGLAMTAGVIGSAFGPLPFGVAFDTFGSYNQILYLMMIFPVAAALLGLFSPPPQKTAFVQAGGAEGRAD